MTFIENLLRPNLLFMGLLLRCASLLLSFFSNSSQILCSFDHSLSLWIKSVTFFIERDLTLFFILLKFVYQTSPEERKRLDSHGE